MRLKSLALGAFPAGAPGGAGVADDPAEAVVAAAAVVGAAVVGAAVVAAAVVAAAVVAAAVVAAVELGGTISRANALGASAAKRKPATTRCVGRSTGRATAALLLAPRAELIMVATVTTTAAAVAGRPMR
jgi:hypothetical protein